MVVTRSKTNSLPEKREWKEEVVVPVKRGKKRKNAKPLQGACRAKNVKGRVMPELYESKSTEPDPILRSQIHEVLKGIGYRMRGREFESRRAAFKVYKPVQNRLKPGRRKYPSSFQLERRVVSDYHQLAIKLGDPEVRRKFKSTISRAELRLHIERAMLQKEKLKIETAASIADAQRLMNNEPSSDQEEERSAESQEEEEDDIDDIDMSTAGIIKTLELAATPDWATGPRVDDEADDGEEISTELDLFVPGQSGSRSSFSSGSEGRRESKAMKWSRGDEEEEEEEEEEDD